MWECRKCRERHEDSFEVCWNCGTSKDGEEDPHFGQVDGSEKAVELEATASTPAQQTRPAPARGIEQLIFVGLNGYALALDRDTGEIVWSNSEMRSGYVSLLLDGDRLIVSTNGYMYCLDPLTGRILWHNPLSGYGLGTPTSLLSVRGSSSASLLTQAAAEIQRSAAKTSHT